MLEIWQRIEKVRRNFLDLVIINGKMVEFGEISDDFRYLCKLILI